MADDATDATVDAQQENGSGGMKSSAPGYVDVSGKETIFEDYMDAILGLAFLITAIVAFRRIRRQQEQVALATGNGGGGGGGVAETTVVTAFYSLIFMTAMLRAVWFLVPAKLWQPSYTPTAVYAFDNDHPSWVGAALSELTVTAGSLTLFSIFVLILVYWADILKKYFHPGSRRSLPMVTFLTLVAILLMLECINLFCFLAKLYTTEGMILFNAVLLASVSIVCVCEITIFSHRFRTVLKTLGAINQVSTDSQVRRIVWITVTGNLFFFSRAFLETLFAVTLFVYWHRNGTVQRAFSHVWWDTYTLLKYWSEVTILSLMLHILQSRFVRQTGGASGTGSASAADQAAGPASASGGKQGYTPVPDAEPSDMAVSV